MQRTMRGMRSSSGQSMIEAAFAIPFMFLCVVGIIYFGRAAYVDQIITYAAQEGARAASSVTNLSDPSVRDVVRGFTAGGQQTNTASVIYSILASARLLTNGQAGNLPQGAQVKILPWDGDGSAADQVPTGTIAVRIQYPFSLLTNPATGTTGEVKQININVSADSSNPPVRFLDFPMSEKATVAQSIYQGS
jgi:Flp pilus assembly protein TadG